MIDLEYLRDAHRYGPWEFDTWLKAAIPGLRTKSSSLFKGLSGDAPVEAFRSGFEVRGCL